MHEPLRIGSLCAGYGGLDMGVSQILKAEPAWFCEWADDPSLILDHHYPTLPNYRDLTTTDWATVEPIDIITAGWPCQPWSLAGAQKGADDERAIWPAIAHAIRSLRPRYVFLENVRAIVGVGELARAVGDLAAAGYDAQWECVRASDFGAPHRRDRCFIFASDTHYAAEHGQRPREEPREGVATAADSQGVTGRIRNRDDVQTRRRTNRRQQDTGPGSVADSSLRAGDVQQSSPACFGHFPTGGRSGGKPDVDWGIYDPTIRRWERILGRPAPEPTEASRGTARRLNPVLIEWMMGLPEGWVTGVPGLSREGQLKALGNGVVPQQAAGVLSRMLPLALAA